MKKILPVLMIASIFMACNSKSDLNANKAILTDTSSMYKSNIMTDTGSMIQTQSLNKGNAAAANPNMYTTTTTTTTTGPTPVPAVRHTSTTRAYSSGGSGQTTRTVYRRKGWSHGAKDAVIGGVGGAVAGAIIGKGKGALIGGVVGATGGYIIGRSRDKREGR
jgi:hypothetical protein